MFTPISRMYTGKGPVTVWVFWGCCFYSASAATLTMTTAIQSILRTQDE